MRRSKDTRLFTVGWKDVTWSYNIEIKPRPLTDDEFNLLIETFVRPYVTYNHVATDLSRDFGDHTASLIVKRIPSREEVAETKKKRKAAVLEHQMKVDANIEEYEAKKRMFTKPDSNLPFFIDSPLYQVEGNGNKAIYWGDIARGPNGGRRRFFNVYFLDVDGTIIHHECTSANKVVPKDCIDGSVYNLLSYAKTQVDVHVHMIREDKRDPYDYHDFEEPYRFCISASQTGCFTI